MCSLLSQIRPNHSIKFNFVSNMELNKIKLYNTTNKLLKNYAISIHLIVKLLDFLYNEHKRTIRDSRGH